MKDFDLLIVGYGNHQYITNFVKWLRFSNNTWQISIVSIEKVNDENLHLYDSLFIVDEFSNEFKMPVGFRWIVRSFRLFKAIKSSGKGKNAILFHSIIHSSLWITGLFIKRLTDNFVLAIWGSDFYRAKSKFILGLILRKFDRIVLSSPNMITDISTQFNQLQKNVHLCYFGSEPIMNLQEVKKLGITRDESCTILDLDPQKINVFIGHNGSPAHQHLKVIDILSHLPQDLKNKMCFVFPLTYCLNESYFEELVEALKDVGVDYKLLTQFLSESEVGHLRNCTDIMVNVQTTDAFSGTMKEVLFAGGLVINGSWLPYEFLTDMGIKFISVDKVEDLENTMIDVLANIDNYRKDIIRNSALIFKMSNWPDNISDWTRVLSEP